MTSPVDETSRIAELEAELGRKRNVIADMKLVWEHMAEVMTEATGLAGLRETEPESVMETIMECVALLGIEVRRFINEVPALMVEQTEARTPHLRDMAAEQAGARGTLAHRLRWTVPIEPGQTAAPISAGAAK